MREDHHGGSGGPPKDDKAGRTIRLEVVIHQETTREGQKKADKVLMVDHHRARTKNGEVVMVMFYHET